MQSARRRALGGAALLPRVSRRTSTTAVWPHKRLSHVRPHPVCPLFSSCACSHTALTLPVSSPPAVSAEGGSPLRLAALLSSILASVVACCFASSPAALCDQGRDEQRIEGAAAAAAPVPLTDGGLRLLVQQGRAQLSIPDPTLSTEEWEYLQDYVDDCLLYRYLVAHSFNLDRAVRAIKGTVRWRVGQQIDALLPHSHEQLRAKILDHSVTRTPHTSNTMWVSRGVACDGSPVVMNRKSPLPELDHNAQFDVIVYTLERAIRSHSPTPPTSSTSLPTACRCQWVWFLDMASFNSGSSTPLSEAQRVVDVLQSHYVERLSVAIVLDAPLYFSFIFRAVSVFLPAKTKSKVVFVRDMTDERTRATVARYVALEQLEQPYGLMAPITMQQYLDEEPTRGPHASAHTQ